MSTAWFLILALMMTAYAILDGFDLGVGILLPWLCKDEKERLAARHAIGPIWNGNEVWLLAGGGAMFCAFPRLYASSFSGFYLALMLVLWLLMGRGIGFEFRHAHNSKLWTGIWDFVFSLASLLIALLFGVAVGNVLRGVPLDAAGQFQGSFTIMLNPFALVGGLLSVAVISMHGAAFLASYTGGALQERARKATAGIWVAVVAITVLLVAASFMVRPTFVHNFLHMPILLIVPILTAVAFVTIPTAAMKKRDGLLFASTCVTIATLLGSAAAGLYPVMLPKLAGSAGSDLTIYNSSAGTHGQTIALVFNLVGMTVVLLYTSYIYKVWHANQKAAAEAA